MRYGPVADDHREAFHRLLEYAFAPERGPDFESDPRERPAIFEPRGLYDAPPEAGEEALSPASLRAICGYYDFTARVRGEWHPLGGVAAVASPPESRREGNVAHLLDSVLAELREAGIYLSALWPFDHGFYRQWGYATAAPCAAATVPPDELTSVAAEPAGSFRALDADDGDDVAALDAVYREWATEGLALRRTEEWWRRRVFAPSGGDRYVYGWVDADGDLRGYVAYRIGDGGDGGRTMDVAELAAADARARGQLLRFCRNHDSQVARVRLRGRETPRLLETLGDPDAVDAELRPGPMVRVVDLPAAVEALSVPAGADAAFTVAVDDGRCEWNDGTFAVEARDGRATCEPTDRAADLSADVGSLSLALLGVRDVDRLRRAGGLTVRSEEAAESLAALFPPEPTYLRERF